MVRTRAAAFRTFGGDAALISEMRHSGNVSKADRRALRISSGGFVSNGRVREAGTKIC